MKAIFAGVVLLAALIGGGARAQTVTFDTGELARQCAAVAASYEREISVDEALDATACQSYVRGVRHGFEDAQFSAGRPDSAFCVSGVTIGEQAMAFHRWAQRHPESRGDPPSVSVLLALGEAYRCRD